MLRSAAHIIGNLPKKCNGLILPDQCFWKSKAAYWQEEFCRSFPAE
jgi:hypothetical protein